jgi:hypothetical protein
VHFSQSFSASVFSACSCSNSLVAAGRVASWRLCVKMSFLSGKSVVQFRWLWRCRAVCASFASAGERRNCIVRASVHSTQSIRLIPTNSGRGSPIVWFVFAWFFQAEDQSERTQLWVLNAPWNTPVPTRGVSHKELDILSGCFFVDLGHFPRILRLLYV